MNVKALLEHIENQPSNGGNISHIACMEILKAKACIETDVLCKRDLVEYFKHIERVNKSEKKFIIDIFNRDSSGGYKSIQTALLLDLNEIRTDHICLVNTAYQKGYEIYIYDNTSKRSYKIKDLTDKELKPHHNIEKLILTNQFNSMFDWHF